MKKIKAFTLLIAIFIATNIYAQPVALDPTFGENGMVVIPNTSEIQLVEFDNSGNIIAAGYTINEGKYYLTIVKTDSDGVIDLSFGNNGVVNGTEISKMLRLSLKITDANKIFIAESFYADPSQSNDYRTTYMRFNEDGSVDETFGDHGKIIIDYSNPPFRNFSLNTENNDFLLFGGIDMNSYDPCILKYNYDGELDKNFGENGIVYLTDHETFKITPMVIKTLSDQSIFIGGFDHMDSWGATELAFCKLTSNGNLATDFANNGLWKMRISIAGMEEFEYFADVMEKSNGELVLLGTIYSIRASNNPKPVFVCNFHSNGGINENFGTDGFYYYRFGILPERIRPSAQKILQNGSKYIAAFQHDKIISINHNGTLDTAFNNTGVFVCENYAFEDVKLQGTNKLILGGRSNGNFALVRLNIPYTSEVSIKQNNYLNDLPLIFPNPAKDYLYFNAEKQFEIMDLQGRVLLKSEKPLQSVNVSHLKAGVYFIRFEGDRVGKFVKE